MRTVTVGRQWNLRHAFNRLPRNPGMRQAYKGSRAHLIYSARQALFLRSAHRCRQGVQRCKKRKTEYRPVPSRWPIKARPTGSSRVCTPSASAFAAFESCARFRPQGYPSWPHGACDFRTERFSAPAFWLLRGSEFPRRASEYHGFFPGDRAVRRVPCGNRGFNCDHIAQTARGRAPPGALRLNAA